MRGRVFTVSMQPVLDISPLRDINLQREDCILLNQPGLPNPGWQNWVQRQILQVLPNVISLRVVDFMCATDQV